MIGCGPDEQPFNFMGRKLLNLPKNSFWNAKYANDLIKWHKLCHMINHVIILIQHFRYVSDRINSYNFWRVLFVVVMDQRTKPINCTGPNFRGPIIHECSIGWDTIMVSNLSSRRNQLKLVSACLTCSKLDCTSLNQFLDYRSKQRSGLLMTKQVPNLHSIFTLFACLRRPKMDFYKLRTLLTYRIWGF